MYAVAGVGVCGGGGVGAFGCWALVMASPLAWAGVGVGTIGAVAGVGTIGGGGAIVMGVVVALALVVTMCLLRTLVLSVVVWRLWTPVYVVVMLVWW